MTLDFTSRFPIISSRKQEHYRQRDQSNSEVVVIGNDKTEDRENHCHREEEHAHRVRQHVVHDTKQEMISL